MAQMTIQTRQDIEGCLKRGMSVPQIATKVGSNNLRKALCALLAPSLRQSLKE